MLALARPCKVKIELNSIFVHLLTVFSSPGRRPGRAIVLPPASALVLASVLASALAAASALAKCKSFTFKFFM